MRDKEIGVKGEHMLGNNGNPVQDPVSLAEELGVRQNVGKCSYLDREGRLFSCVGEYFGIAQLSKDGSLVFMPADKPLSAVVAQEIRLDSDK